MSQWTHVCGCIRIDCFHHEYVNSKIEEILGKILRYESEMWGWELQDSNPELYTPTGSEGGVEYDVWVNPDKCCVPSHTISIWGDLRDYCSVTQITDWFNKILYHSGLLIRDAVLSIDVERAAKTVLLYKDGADKCIVIKEEETSNE